MAMTRAEAISQAMSSKTQPQGAEWDWLLIGGGLLAVVVLFILGYMISQQSNRRPRR